MPVGIAAGAAKQIDLPRRAFKEGHAQIGDQHAVIANGGGQCRIESARIIGHGDQRYLACVKFW